MTREKHRLLVSQFFWTRQHRYWKDSSNRICHRKVWEIKINLCGPLQASNEITQRLIPCEERRPMAFTSDRARSTTEEISSVVPQST